MSSINYIALYSRVSKAHSLVVDLWALGYTYKQYLCVCKNHMMVVLSFYKYTQITLACEMQMRSEIE